MSKTSELSRTHSHPSCRQNCLCNQVLPHPTRLCSLVKLTPFAPGGGLWGLGPAMLLVNRRCLQWLCAHTWLRGWRLPGGTQERLLTLFSFQVFLCAAVTSCDICDSNPCVLHLRLKALPKGDRVKTQANIWIPLDIFEPLNEPLSGLLIIYGNTCPYDLHQVPLKVG